ncbi:hypothetical protein [Streptomyces sp. C10-9-1]|uniref:hypothetical protein n=2 Tax=Streptomyces sp. C10-9-1 TaxID=1859285 RepID=UPI003F4A4636
MTGTGTPTPPPEASLIRLAREATGLSPESAAAQAEIKLSGSRWRQIEAGYRKDSDKPVVARAHTLAHMAHAVGITPDRLEAAGRPDAAEVLQEIARPSTPAAMISALAGLEPWQRDVILRSLDARPRSRREKALLLRTLAEEIERQADADRDPPLGTEEAL